MVELASHPFALSLPLLFTAMGDESWRVRKESVAVLCRANDREEAVEGLISLLRASDNAGLRNSAVESLERLGAVAVEPLCRHLDDPDHDLRKFVIDILGSIRCASCVPLLVKALHDSDPNVRVAAAENLGKIGDPAAVPSLLEVLEGEEIWLKFTVLDALTLIGAPISLATLMPLLEEKLLRRAVYDCLAAVGDPASIPVLLEGIGDKGKAPREAAAVALMRVRERLAEGEVSSLIDISLKKLSGTPAAEGIIASLGSAEASRLESLVRIAGLIGDGRATLPLLAMAAEERLTKSCLDAFRAIGAAALPKLLAHFGVADDAGRALVAHLLGELGCRDAVGLLVSHLADEAPELRAACASALGKLAPEGASAPVAELLDDRHPLVRDAALEALQRLSAADPAAISSLCSELSRSGDAGKRRQAALLLSGVSDGDRLSLLVKDEDPSVRRAAVSSLSRMRLPQAVPPLAMALSDEDAEVRVAAAQALAEIGGDDVLEPLVLALGDSDPWVQTAALKGLSSLGNRAALPAIKALLASAQGPVLIAGLSTIAAVGGSDHLSPVREALAHADEDVVEAAIGIMAGTGSGWIDEHFEALIGHPHWVVRRSFVRAVAQLLGAKALPLLDEALAKESDPLVKGEMVGLMGGLSNALQ